MELRHLRYFVAVGEELHFGRAAERLHMAQPPLSQQIRQLEAELGLPLLRRTTRQVSLTPAGERYLDRARALLAAVEDAGEEAARIAAGSIGRVSLGFIGSATYALLPRLARDLREQLPGIDLEISGEMLTPRQEEALVAGSLDLALMRTPVIDPAIDVRPLSREEVVVVLPQEHPLALRASVDLADLADEPFVAYPSGHRSVLHDTMVSVCQAAGFRPQVAVQAAETSTLIVFVAAGLGVALVPESVRRLGVAGAVFRPIRPGSGEVPWVELALGRRKDEQDPAVLAVAQRITQRIEELLA